MCEQCVNYELDDNEFLEVTQEDIDHWKEKGKYYGYPQCCIDAFCNRIDLNLTPAQEQVLDNHGFIPCHDHALMVVKGEITLESLIENRKCQYDYPMDDHDAQIVKFIIDNDEELRQEFLDAGYISEEKKEI
jgi:hypothetical protein